MTVGLVQRIANLRGQGEGLGQFQWITFQPHIQRCLSLQSGELNLAERDGAGRHVDHDRGLLEARKRDGDWVGAEHRLDAPKWAASGLALVIDRPIASSSSAWWTYQPAMPQWLEWKTHTQPLPTDRPFRGPCRPVAAVAAAKTGKAANEAAAFKELTQNLADDLAPRAVLLPVALVVDALEFLVVVLDQGKERAGSRGL